MAREWNLGYSYSNKGLGSVINTFSNSDIKADNISHIFDGKFMLADSLTIGAKAQFHKQKSNLDGAGNPLGGTNGAHIVKQRRYEFYASFEL